MTSKRKRKTVSQFRNRKKRIRAISIILLVFGLILIGRLYHVQVIESEKYNILANDQYVQSTGNIYNRGEIFFTNKHNEQVRAATLKSGYKVAINPEIIKKPEEKFKKLSKLLNIEKENFLQKSRKQNDPYEEITKRVTKEKAKKVNRMGLNGVTTHLERWRFYPAGKLASREVGFVAYKEDELTGRYGLEKSYNNILERNDKSIYINFFAKIFTDLKETITMDENKREGDLITTLEPSVQLYLEDRLESIHEEYKSQTTGGIVINPQNGEVYAMSTKPNFNLNNFGQIKDPSIFSNPLVNNIYEMGSIIKSLTMAAGLDSGVVTPKTTYYDAGKIKINGSTIYNYDKKGRGEVGMQKVLDDSLNTGAAFVQERMGTTTFTRYMKNFSLGEKTGIDLPNEANGMLNNLNSPRRLEYATASFGQGIAISPITTVRALCSLANGGKLITPHLGKKIKYKSGLSGKINPEPGPRVLKASTAHTITRMLVGVGDQATLGGKKPPSNYSIALKTGTAQIPNHQSGGYYDNKYLHSFFGYFPAYNPKYLVFLFTVDPKGVRYSSQSLGPEFLEISDFLINYYNIPPDR